MKTMAAAYLADLSRPLDSEMLSRATSDDVKEAKDWLQDPARKWRATRSKQANVRIKALSEIKMDAQTIRLSNRNAAVLCDFSRGFDTTVLGQSTLEELAEAFTWINESKDGWLPWRQDEANNRLALIEAHIKELTTIMSTVRHDDPIVDLNTPITDILLNGLTVPQIKRSIGWLLNQSRDVIYSKEAQKLLHDRADLLQRIVNQLVPSCAAIRLGDPEIGTIQVNGVWIVPTEYQIEHEMIGHLVKGKLVYCTQCALKHELTKPAAIALYPVNILPYSQQCRSCHKVLVSGLRHSDGSGQYLNLLEV